MNTSTPSRRKQSGSALVVGLILLVAVSLMAISSLNTASLDLIMAGNEQYHNRAFHVAEAGIEAAWKNTPAFSTNANYPASAGAFTTAATTTGNDSYSYRVTRPGNGSIEEAPMGSGNLVGLVRFNIESRGSSDRGSATTHVQELYWEVKKVDDFGLLRNTSNVSVCGTSNLDATTSTC